MIKDELGILKPTKKEEIIGTWRKIGLLQGIKEGSVHEWRCAKSYDNLAKHMTYGDVPEEILNALQVISFPIIRRSIMNSGKKVTRIMEGNEIVDAFSEITLNECLDTAKEKKRGTKSKLFFNIFSRLLDEYGLGKKTIVEVMNTIYNAKPEDSLSRTLKVIGLDFEAEVCALCVEPFRKRMMMSDIEKKRN